MKAKNYFLLWVLSIVLYIGIAPLRGYLLGFHWAEIIHSIAFAVFTWWALSKYASKAGFWKVLIPILAPWIFELTFRMFMLKDGGLITLPITLIPLFAIISVVLFFRYRKKWILLLFTLIWLFSVTEGEEQWYEWYIYGDKPVNTINLAECEVEDSTHVLKLSELEADYIVIDAWFSRCGVCFEEMPKVDVLRDDYKDNDRVAVISLFVTFFDGETVYDGCRLMKDMGCDVPVYGINEDSPILKKCEIDGFPTVLILNKERNVIFNGSIDFAKRKLKEVL